MFFSPTVRTPPRYPHWTTPLIADVLLGQPPTSNYKMILILKALTLYFYCTLPRKFSADPLAGRMYYQDALYGVYKPVSFTAKT